VPAAENRVPFPCPKNKNINSAQGRHLYCEGDIKQWQNDFRKNIGLLNNFNRNRLTSITGIRSKKRSRRNNMHHAIFESSLKAIAFA
jgi:hypothetical protein